MRSTAKTKSAALFATVAAGALLLSACTDTGGNTGEGDKLSSVNIIVPADPGGGWDATGRSIQKVLGDTKLVESAPVENIGGAGGTIGLAQINNKDWNTLFVTGLVMVGAVETNNSVVRIEETTPIARLTEEALVIVVPAASKYQTLSELIEDIKANKHAVSVTGGSRGGADHILIAQVLGAAGVQAADLDSTLNYDPNSGGAEAITKLLGNHVAAGVSGIGEFQAYIDNGDLRALAVSSADRKTSLSEVPTIIEAGYQVELTNWRGLLAPGKISDEQKAQLVKLVTDLHADPAWKTEIDSKGWDDAFLAGAEFDSYLKGNITDIQATLKAVGLIN